MQLKQLNPLRIKDHYGIQVDKKRLIEPHGNPIAEREADAPVSGPLLQGVIEQREKLNQPVLNEAGDVDLSDIYLRQETRDESGNLRNRFDYFINQRVVTAEETKWVETDERNWKPHWQGATLHLERVGRKKEDRVREPKKVSVIDLDVYDTDKKLVATLYFDDMKKFLAFLDSHDKEDVRIKREKSAAKLGYKTPPYNTTQTGSMQPGNIQIFNSDLPRGEIVDWNWTHEYPWAPENVTPPYERAQGQKLRINIPRRHHKDALLDVKQSRERLNIPGTSYFGLTIKKKRRGEGSAYHTLQVTEDSLLYTPDPPGKDIKHAGDLAHCTTTRIVKLTEYDEHGNPVQQDVTGEDAYSRTYTIKELGNLMNEDDVADIYWEITGDTLRGRAQVTELGRTALRGLKKFPWSDIESRGLSLNEAVTLLYGPDIHNQKKVLEKAGQHQPQSGRDRQLAESLRKTIQKFGVDEVNSWAEQLREDYLISANMLGLYDPEKKSLSWALRHIAQEGIDIDLDDHPLSRPIEALHKRRQLVDREIGLAFIDKVFKPVLKEKANSEERFIVLEKDHELVDSLQEFIKEDVNYAIDALLNSGLLVDALQKSLKTVGAKSAPDKLSSDRNVLDLLVLDEIRIPLEALGRELQGGLKR